MVALGDEEDDVADEGCSVHGLGAHVSVHEAGHAVAAFDHGIPYSAIVSFDGGDAPQIDGLSHAVAQLVLTGTPREIVKPNPVSAFAFAMSGVQAEQAVLGDHIDSGFEEDFRFWRRGSGTTGENSGAAIERILGRSITEALQPVESWSEANVERIQAVASMLNERPRPWNVSRQDVEATLRRRP